MEDKTNEYEIVGTNKVAIDRKKEELENVEDERKKMLDDLMEKAKLDASQKEEYMRKLKIQDKQIADLQQELMRMRRIERNIRMDSDIYRNYLDGLNPRMLRAIQDFPPSEWPPSVKEKYKEHHMIESDGNFTRLGHDLLRQNLD